MSAKGDKYHPNTDIQSTCLVASLLVQDTEDSNSKKEIPQELVDGSYDIPGGRFVSFTPKFKYLGATKHKSQKIK